MKLIDAIKIKQGRFEIPDCNRGDLPEFFKEMRYKVGVEVGVYKGEYTAQLAQSGAQIYGVDPWRCYEDYDEKSGKFQEKQDFLYDLAQKNTAPYSNITLIRKSSMEAVKDFENESLDFVYLDGHHGFRHVADDIWEWSKKIRKGGILSGHDYGVLGRKKTSDYHPYNNHVRYVVDAYVLATQIQNWYVLGSKNKVPGEKRDNWRSWMWIKEHD